MSVADTVAVIAADVSTVLTVESTIVESVVGVSVEVLLPEHDAIRTVAAKSTNNCFIYVCFLILIYITNVFLCFKKTENIFSFCFTKIRKISVPPNISEKIF